VRYSGLVQLGDGLSQGDRRLREHQTYDISSGDSVL